MCTVESWTRSSLNLMLLLSLSLALAAVPNNDDLAWEFHAEALVAGKLAPTSGAISLNSEGDRDFLAEGPGLLFNGHQSALTSLIETPGAVLPKRRMAVEAWAVVDRPGPWGGFLGAVEDNGDVERGWLLGIRNQRYCFAIATEEQGRLEYLTAPKTLRTGEWAHVVGTYDGKTARLYVNGLEVAFSEAPGGDLLYAESHILAAGAYKDTNEEHPLAGVLLRAKVHDDRIKPGEVRRRFITESRSLPKLPSSAQRGIPSRWPDQFQPRINGAINRGVTRLIEMQARDGSWGQHYEKYRSGMTVLATYALLKSGVSVAHPSVQAGLRFIYQEEPARTYTAGVMMMLLRHLIEHGDPNNKALYMERAERIIDRILEWERRDPDTGWAYPEGNYDLSCTQYAALALWSAHELGIKTPRNVYVRMINGLHKHYGGLEGEFPAAPGSGLKTNPTRGYRYRGDRTDSRSMSTAAIAICRIAEICAGKNLGGPSRRFAESQLTAAINWLEINWSMTSAPNSYDFYYYLYGVERAAGLPGMEGRIRADWYFEGADHLLGQQKEDGGWSTQSNTAFTLLFLVKATAAMTGKKAQVIGQSAKKEEGPLHFRAHGNLDVTVFMTGIDPKVLAPYAEQPAPKTGLRVVRVEYLINGKPRAAVDGDPLKPWVQERFPTKIRFKHPETVTVQVVATVVALGEYPDNYNKTTELRSLPLTYKVERNQKELLRDARPFLGENLLRHAASTMHASSEVASRGTGYLTDGIHSTYWQAGPDDAKPWVQIDLQRPARANHLVLSQAVAARSQLGTWNPIKDVKITVNGRYDVLASLHSDAIIPTRIELGIDKPILSIRVQILSRWHGPKGHVGWAQIALEN